MSFDEIYDKYLLKPLTIIDGYRLKELNKFKKQLLISLALLLSFILSVSQDAIKLVSLVLLMSFLGLSATAINKLMRVMKVMKPRYKSAVILPILKSMYSNIEYFPRQRIPIRILEESLLLKRPVHRTVGDDYVKCRIGDTLIQFSEIEAYQRKTMFYAGIFISVSFNKSFKTKTIIYPKNMSNRAHRFNLMMNKKMNKPTEITLEDPVFNNEYIVIAEDKVEARYILSTKLMQRLLEYKKLFSKDVSFSFINNTLYLSIPIRQDMFEPRTFKTVLDKEFIRKDYEYFKLLLSVVQELDLNTRIWV